ncbi:MAG: nucleotidyltransferase domain-containing protein [Chloroflexi bacterium]|nr:nucleotidyltransferase domain-containing protein [Chloroflexota bacterium]
MQARAEIPTLDTIRDALTPALEASDAQRAIVFGSYARGDADEYSDLDLIIVAETDKRFLQRHKDYRPVFRLWDPWGKSLDMLIYTPKKLDGMQRQNRSFICRALAEGVVIYEGE